MMNDSKQHLSNLQQIMSPKKSNQYPDIFSRDQISSGYPTQQPISQGLQLLQKSKKKQENSESEYFVNKTKQQLMDDLELQKRRISETESSKESFYERLSLQQRNQLTREQRSLQKFEFQNQKWISLSNRISKMIARKNTQKTLHDRIEDYREQVEAAELREIVKPQAEKVGDNLWYLSLRHDSHQKPPFEYMQIENRSVIVEPRGLQTCEKSIQNISTGFSSVVISDPTKSLEIIKKSRKFQSRTPIQKTFLKPLADCRVPNTDISTVEQIKVLDQSVSYHFLFFSHFAKLTFFLIFKL